MVMVQLVELPLQASIVAGEPPKSKVSLSFSSSPIAVTVIPPSTEPTFGFRLLIVVCTPDPVICTWPALPERSREGMHVGPCALSQTWSAAFASPLAVGVNRTVTAQLCSVSRTPTPSGEAILQVLNKIEKSDEPLICAESMVKSALPLLVRVMFNAAEVPILTVGNVRALGENSIAGA